MDGHRVSVRLVALAAGRCRMIDSYMITWNPVLQYVSGMSWVGGCVHRD